MRLVALDRFALIKMTKNSKPGSGTAQGGGRKTPRNHCFGCGADNPAGLRLKFVFDKERQRFTCRFKLLRHYVGPPGHAHGGIIATILDESMGKATIPRGVTVVTKEMIVEYVKPVPLGKPLIAEGWEQSVHGRVHRNVAEIRNPEGEVLARSQGTFIAIDPRIMFARHLKGGASWPWSALKQVKT